MATPSEELSAYEANASAVREAIAGLSHEQLSAHPVPGTWSIQQIVTHLADCEGAFAGRMKWVIAEENPPIPAFDENKWMEKLAPSGRPAAEEAALLEGIRKQMVWILRELPPAAFERKGVHSEAGPITLAAIIEKANWHLEHHMKFLRQKRDLVTK